jgi:hypothetical protein
MNENNSIIIEKKRKLCYSSYKHECEYCDYRTNKIHEWTRHINTKKHTKLATINGTSESYISYSCPCGKTMRSKSGFYKHKNICSLTNSQIVIDIEDINTSSNVAPVNLNQIITKDFIISIIQQNHELKSMLMEERELRKEDSEELKAMIEELAKQPTIVNNSTNTTNNTQFNLNIFLNEKCKDAITLTQFVDSLEVGPHNVEYTGVHGYVAGISKIFMDGLRQLDVYKRPIHCTDLKREILYIKEDDVWEKDNPEKSKFKKALNAVVRKNMQQMSVWMNQNPRCEILDTTEYHLHLDIMRQCIGGDISQEESNNRKILRNIAKEVVINRTTM